MSTPRPSHSPRIPSIPSQLHEHPRRVWLTQTQHDSDRRRNKTANGYFESEDERYASRRDRERKQRSLARSSKTEAFTPSTLHHNPATASIHKDTRPPSRNTSTPTPYQTNPSESHLHSHVHPQSSSRSQQRRSNTPELHDVRTCSHKRPLVTPNRKSSFEQASEAEDNATSPRHLRTPGATRTNTPVAWNHAEHETSTSRRHLERDKDRERDGRCGRSLDKCNEDRIESKSLDKEKKEFERPKVDRTMEADRTREHQKSVDKKREYHSRTEHKSSSRPPTSSVATPDHRTQESEISDSGIRRPTTPLHGHRRHRTEEGTQATPCDRRLQSDHSQNGIPYQSPKISDAPAMSQNLVLSHPYFHQENPIPPPGPRIMPVYLPEQKVKATKSRHERNMSLPADLLIGALTDTEDVRRRDISFHIDRLREHQAVHMSQNIDSAITTVKQSTSQNVTQEHATGTRVTGIGTDIGKPSDKLDTSPPKASDIKSDVLEISRLTTSVQVNTGGEKRKQTIEMPHLPDSRPGQDAAEARSIDTQSKPISKWESLKYHATSRSIDQPTRGRSDKPRSSASQLYIPTSRSSMPASKTVNAVTDISPPIASVPPPPITQNTSYSNTTSPSIETVIPTPKPPSRLPVLGAVSHEKVSNRYAHQDPSSIPDSRVPPSASPASSPLMLQSKAGDHDVKTLLASLLKQSKDNQTIQLPNRSPEHHDYSMTSLPLITKAVDSAKYQIAQEASLTAAAKNSSSTTHAPSSGIPPSFSPSLTPLEQQKRLPRQTRQPECPAKTGDSSSFNTGITIDPPKPKPEITQREQSSLANYDNSPQSLPSPLNAVATLKQQLNAILSPTTHSPEAVKYSSLSNKSQPSEDSTVLPSTNATVIHQIQGQLQKLFSATKPVEQETGRNIAPLRATATQKSNVTDLIPDTPKQSRIDDPHISSVTIDPVLNAASSSSTGVDSSAFSLGNQTSLPSLKPENERTGILPAAASSHAQWNLSKGTSVLRRNDRPANDLPDSPHRSLTKALLQEQRQLSQKATGSVTIETQALSLENPQPITIGVWQARIEVPPPTVLPPYLSESTSQLLPRSQQLSALAVPGPVSNGDVPAGESPAHKTQKMVTVTDAQAIRERIEKNIAPQCYIPLSSDPMGIPESFRMRDLANANAPQAAVHPPVPLIPDIFKRDVFKPDLASNRTSPDESRPPSRNSPALAKSHDRVLASPTLRTDQSQYSFHPKTSTLSQKNLNLHPANIRSHSMTHSYSTSPSTAHTSTSRLQENSAVGGFALVQNSVSTPSSAGSTRRAYDAPTTTSTLLSAVLQSKTHPHHTTPSAPNHHSSAPNTQTLSPPLRSTPPSTNQPWIDSVRPQVSVGQRQQHTAQAMHTRVASDPPTSVTRASASGNKPAPIITKQIQMVRNVSTESESILHTPSSLANSRPPSRVAATAPPSEQLYESRKPDVEQNPTGVKTPVDSSPNEQYVSKTSRKDEPRTKQRSSAKVSGTRPSGALTIKTDIPSIVVQTTTCIELPGSLALAPFRLVSSHRQQRVSIASLEAVNGTAANTVIGSPTTSIYSQAPPLPPIRDPIVATQEWRNKGEAELKSRRNARRHRPGVVFDVADETPPDHRHPGGSNTTSTSARPSRR